MERERERENVGSNVRREKLGGRMLSERVMWEEKESQYRAILMYMRGQDTERD